MADGFQQIKKQAFRVLGPTLGILACVYFSYHAFQGDRGLGALIDLKEKVAAAQATARELERRRDHWKHRVGLISAASLDLDMLEERARVMLNVGFSRDHVILLDRGED